MLKSYTENEVWFGLYSCSKNAEGVLRWEEDRSQFFQTLSPQCFLAGCLFLMTANKIEDTLPTAMQIHPRSISGCKSLQSLWPIAIIVYKYGATVTITVNIWQQYGVFSAGRKFISVGRGRFKRTATGGSRERGGGAGAMEGIFKSGGGGKRIRKDP